MKGITVRLTPNQQFELDNIAKETGVNKSAVVRAALIHLIETYNKSKEV